MLKCNDCGAVFEEPWVQRECVGEYWGQPAYQEFAYCPFCESDAIEEVNFEEEEDGEE